MESPGEYLKRERELRGVSLAKIHEATRVPMKYLEAIEKDEYEGMPHPTFVKGYIKSYCKVLGLDETDAALRFEVYMREHAAEAERTESARPVARKKPAEAQRPAKEEAQKGLNAVVFAAVGVIIVAIIYFVAVNKKEPVPTAEPPGARVEEVKPPEAAAPAVEPREPSTAPEAQTQQAGKAEPEKTEKKAEAPRTAAMPEKPVAAIKPAPQATAAQKPAPEQAPVQKPAVTAPVPAPTEEKLLAAQTAEKRHSLTVSATEQAWVKVGIDGSEPFDVLLRAGESVSWKAAENFQVTVGNAGGVDVTYDGKRLPRLGESGQVVHMTLPGELPRARTLPAPVAPKETEPAINLPGPAEKSN